MLGTLRAILARLLATTDGHGSPAATVVVFAASPFAPTSYGRARLLRQMHAGGVVIGRPTACRVADPPPHAGGC